MSPLVEPQRIFLEGPSRNAQDIQGHRTSFKDFRGLARTTHNLQGKPKNSTKPLFSHFHLFSGLLWQVWSGLFGALELSLDQWCGQRIAFKKALPFFDIFGTWKTPFVKLIFQSNSPQFAVNFHVFLVVASYNFSNLVIVRSSPKSRRSCNNIFV